MTNLDKIARWESLWTTYVEKLARIDELRAQGRYGYQLSQPKRALRIAAKAVADFDREYGERPVGHPRQAGVLVWEGQ